MLNITFERTQTERTGDNARPFQFNHSKEHKARLEAHADRIHWEFFAKKGCNCDLCRAFTPKVG